MKENAQQLNTYEQRLEEQKIKLNNYCGLNEKIVPLIVEIYKNKNDPHLKFEIAGYVIVERSIIWKQIDIWHYDESWRKTDINMLDLSWQFTALEEIIGDGEISNGKLIPVMEKIGEAEKIIGWKVQGSTDPNVFWGTF